MVVITIQPNEQESISYFKKLRIYFREYSTRTSIHGFRYFGERRPHFEKVWWFLVFAISLAACSYSIRLVYIKWDETPVIVTFNTAPSRMYEIPFPAVTICSEAKIKREFYDKMNQEEFYEELKNRTVNINEQKLLSYTSSVCPAIAEKLGKDHDFLRLYGRKFYSTMEKVTPEFKIDNCYFLKKKRNCNKMFTKIITDAGICQTFNILDRNELFNNNVYHYKDFHRINRSMGNWTMENGYPPFTGPKTYPERSIYPGAKYSLEFRINISNNEVFQNSLCGDMVSGFVALLHIPIRIPRLTHHFIRIPLGSSVVAAVTPATMKTSKSIAIYSPESRHCYFPTERKLKFFKFYSQINCEMECLTNFTLKKCGCVEYYMPRQKGTKICNGNEAACKEKAEDDLLFEEMENKNIARRCDCLPLCTDVTYHSSISQANWAPINIPTDDIDDDDYYNNGRVEWLEELDDDIEDDQDDTINSDDRIVLLQSSVNQTPDVMNFSQFTVYFVSGDLIGSQRVGLYGPTDFLANFGGLLSLFTGFSVLSLMEIIYFLTVRWCCNRRIYNRFTENEN